MNQFTIEEKDGSQTEYVIDNNGAIKQLYPKRFTYDPAYSAIYDTPQYQENSERLQLIRLAVSTTNGLPRRLLDVGYGNGAFLAMATKRLTPKDSVIVGYDITGVAVPEGCETLLELPVYKSWDFNKKYFDLITFWDVLEHFPDLSFVKGLMTSRIVISLPWCHFMDIASRPGEIATPDAFDKAVEWFTTWHHRKPNEHLHHFDPVTLKLTMATLGYNMVSYSNIEDMIRKPRDGRENILTAIFQKS